MVQKGWLVSEGKGRGMRYRLKKNILEGGQVEIQGGQVGGQAIEKPDITLSEWKIIQSLQEGAKSSKELKSALSKDNALSGAFKEKLIGLRDKGLIDYKIPDKPTSPNQKYRLTPLGQELLRNRD